MKCKKSKTSTQHGAGIIGDIGDFLKSHKVLSKAGKALTPFVSAWNPAAGVGVAGISAGLDQAGWGKRRAQRKSVKSSTVPSVNRAVPVVSANYGRVKF